METKRYVEESESGIEIMADIVGALTQLLIIIPASLIIGWAKRRR